MTIYTVNKIIGSREPWAVALVSCDDGALKVAAVWPDEPRSPVGGLRVIWAGPAAHKVGERPRTTWTRTRFGASCTRRNSSKGGGHDSALGMKQLMATIADRLLAVESGPGHAGRFWWRTGTLHQVCVPAGVVRGLPALEAPSTRVRHHHARVAPRRLEGSVPPHDPQQSLLGHDHGERGHEPAPSLRPGRREGLRGNGVEVAVPGRGQSAPRAT